MKQQALLKLFPASGPLESVSPDILGPLEKSKRGFPFVLFITDRFTKLTQAVPLRRIRAADVAAGFVDHWVFKYGPPTTLLSDNGPQLASKFFTRVCKVLSITNELTTTYHPQSNGQAERFNRTLLAILRCYVADNPGDWCEYVGALCFAYNTAIHRATRTTPFDLVLSRPPRDFIAARPGPQAPFDKAAFAARLSSALTTASTSLAAAQARYKRDFDKRIRCTRGLTDDEHVYLDISDSTSGKGKLTYQVDGPFTILCAHKDNTVTIHRRDLVERVSVNRVVRAPKTI